MPSVQLEVDGIAVRVARLIIFFNWGTYHEKSYCLKLKFNWVFWVLPRYMSALIELSPPINFQLRRQLALCFAQFGCLVESRAGMDLGCGTGGGGRGQGQHEDEGQSMNRMRSVESGAESQM